MQIFSGDYSLSYADPAEATSRSTLRPSWDDARIESTLLRLHSVIDVLGLWSALQFVLNELLPNDACVLYLNGKTLATPNVKFHKWMELRHQKDQTRPLHSTAVKTKVCKLSDVLFDPRQLCHAEFFRRHMAPESWHHIACASFWEEGTLTAEVAIMRTAQQGTFTDYETATLNRLHPHIEVTLQRLAALEKRMLADTALPSLRGKVPGPTNRERREHNRAARSRHHFDADTLGQALTPAESQLVYLLHTGLSNKEIAARLEKSVRTVKTQLTSIYRKYGVRSRTRLLAVILGAAEQGT